MSLSLAQKNAWSLARTLMVCITLFKAGSWYGVVPSAEFDGDPPTVLRVRPVVVGGENPCVSGGLQIRVPAEPLLRLYFELRRGGGGGATVSHCNGVHRHDHFRDYSFFRSAGRTLLGAVQPRRFGLAVLRRCVRRDGRVPRFRHRYSGRRSNSGRRTVRRHAPAIAAASRRRRAAVCGSGGVRRLPSVPRDRCDDHALRSVAPVVRCSRKPDRRHHRISAGLSATSPLRVQRAAQRPIPAGEIKPSARIPSNSSSGDPGPGDRGGGDASICVAAR